MRIRQPTARLVGPDGKAEHVRSRSETGSPAVPTPGSDPDADEAELFSPGLYTDGPEAGA